MARRFIRIDWTGFARTGHWLQGVALTDYLLQEHFAAHSQAHIYAANPIVQHLEHVEAHERFRRGEAAEIPLAEHPEVGVQMPMRRHYYNPVLDPDVQARKMTDAMRAAVQENRYGWATEPAGGPLHEPDDAHPANLISSLAEDGKHYPVLDLDLEARLVPSSTRGHFHLYLDGLALEWDVYVRLLDALADTGVIERGYAEASKARGQTLVRVPGVPRVTPR